MKDNSFLQDIRFALLIVLLVALFFLEIVEIYQQIQKKELSHIYEPQQELFDDFSVERSSSTLGKPDSVQSLRSSVSKIKQESEHCLAKESWFLNLLIFIKSEQDIFDVCAHNLDITKNILLVIDKYELSEISLDQFSQVLHQTSFNIEDTKPFPENINADFFINFVIFIILDILAVVLCISYFSRPLQKNYKKLKETNEQLREAQQRLALYFQASTVGVWDVPDTKKEYIYLSPQIRQLLGYEDDNDRKETVSEILSLIHPDHVATIKKFQTAAFTHSIAAEDFLMLTKSNGYKWFHSRAIGSINPDTGKNRLTGSISDIHIQKTTTQKLSESMALMKLIFDNNPDMVCVKNRNHEVIDGNQAYFLEYPRSSREEYRKHRSMNLAIFNAEDDIAFETGYSESWPKVTLPSGRIRNYHTRKIRFKNLENEELLLVLAHDITDTEDLITQITRSNQDLEQFAFIASHDLQEPLRMIDSFSTLLKDNIEPQLDKENAEYLRIIQYSVKRMQLLVQDLLVYARLDTKDSANYDEVDLNELMVEILENLQQSLQETNGTLTYECLPSLSTKKSLLKLLLSNLISNAIKYQLSEKTPRIHIDVKEEEDHWLFCVEDNGIGIEERFLKKIFQPFKRLHRKEEYAGTGIGLAICKKAMQQLGGDIWVESEIGKGSKFYFTLPSKMDT